MGRTFALVLSAAISAAVLLSLAALGAGAQTASSQQYASADAAQGKSTTTPERSFDKAEPEASAADGSPSQGTFTEGAVAGPDEPSLVDGTGPAGAPGSGDPVVTASGRGSGKAAVRTARRYIGTKYGYGTCTGSRMSCTCLVKKVFARFGHKLPMSEGGQWKHRPSRKVPKSKLRPGDIVFFKEGGRKRGITHNGIYSGKGNLVHASAYFGKVVESKMSYIKGYSGAKRLRLR
jgi:cell wall-associated NlpC family hydrolase